MRIRLSSIVLLVTLMAASALFRPAPAEEGSGAVGYEIVLRSIVEKTKTASIDVTYPVMTGLRARAPRERLNACVRAIVDEELKSFRESVAGIREDFPKGMLPFTLVMETHVKYRSKSLVSLFLDGYAYTGGAHGMPINRPITFDLEMGRPLRLPEIFTPGFDYLKFLSDQAMAELGRRKLPDEETMRAGAAPKAANFDLWYVNGQALVVVFPPYQVAPYSEGTIEAPVPYDALKDHLKPRVYGMLTQ